MQSGTMTLIIYMLVFFGIMYFLMIRPQQKQQKFRQAMIDSLRIGDKIITVGGIYGKIRKVKDNSVIIQVADKVEIEITKTGVASVENREIVVDNKKKSVKADKKEKDEKNKKKEEATNNTDANNTDTNNADNKEENTSEAQEAK